MAESTRQQAIRARFAKIIAVGKDRGRLTYEELNNLLPDDVASPEQIDELLTLLAKENVQIVNKPSAASRTEARAGKDDWTIRFRASGGQRRANGSALADSLSDETKTLTTLGRDVQAQGGMLWAELTARTALAFCLTLPLPPEAQ